MTEKPTKIDGIYNNCTLVAIRELTGRADQEIIDEMLRQKWTPGQGALDSQYTRALRNLGCDLGEKRYLALEGRTVGVRAPTHKRPTLAQFCRVHSDGVWLVSTGSHAFVVRDGRVVDPNLDHTLGARRRILRAWEVKNPAPSQYLRKRPLSLEGDPMVRFHGRHHRRVGSKSYVREYSALCYLRDTHGDYRKPVRLSEILEKTFYTEADAKWDVRRGRLVVVVDDE